MSLENRKQSFKVIIGRRGNYEKQGTKNSIFDVAFYHVLAAAQLTVVS